MLLGLVGLRAAVAALEGGRPADAESVLEALPEVRLAVLGGLFGLDVGESGLGFARTLQLTKMKFWSSLTARTV